jgi:hypothetical protein
MATSEFTANGDVHASASDDGEAVFVTLDAESESLALRIPFSQASKLILAAITAYGMGTKNRRKRYGSDANALAIDPPSVIAVRNFGLGRADRADGTADILLQFDLGEGAQMHFVMTQEKGEEMRSGLGEVLRELRHRKSPRPT